MANVLELFGGCGGLGFGFEKDGFNMVCCNELEQHIANTYAHNFPKTKLVVGDITKKEIKNQIYHCFQDKKCDIILGGPPCVAYSMSGYRNSRDPRGQLFKDYVDIVAKLQPKLFVMENVKGILNMMHDKPILNDEEQKLADQYYKFENEKLQLQIQKKSITIEKRKYEKKPLENSTKYDEVLKKYKKIVAEHKKATKKVNKMKKDLPKFRTKVYLKIIQTFKDIGYKVEHRLLNSANFGVPQRRERVIFIGVKSDSGLTIAFPEETHTSEQWVSVKEAIDDLKDKPENKEFSHIEFF